MNILLLAKFRHVEITALAASIKPMKYCHLRPIWQCLEQGRVNKECPLINDPHYVGVCCIAMVNQGTVTRKLHIHPPPLSSACNESITILSAPDGGTWWLFSMHFRHTHTQKSHIRMDVSENSGTPKLSILLGFSSINHPFWGTLFLETPVYTNTCIHICKYIHKCIYIYMWNVCLSKCKYIYIYIYL